MRRGIHLLLPLVLVGVVALGLYIQVGRTLDRQAPARRPFAGQRLTVPYAGTGQMPGRGAAGPGYPGEQIPQVGHTDATRSGTGLTGAGVTGADLTVPGVLGGGVAGPNTSADVIPPEVGRITQAQPTPLQEMMQRQNGILQVILTDTGIRPPEIRVRLQERVKLHVVNRGGGRHNLVIPAFSIFGRNLNAGEETYIEFNADKAGRFNYYSDTGHENAPEPGIEGVLQVSL